MVMTMAYMSEVEKKLGKEVVNTMQNSALSGEISEDKMGMIALELGKHEESERPNTIFGNHNQKARNKNIKSDTALREILCDWWSDQLYDISHEEAIDKLIQVFKEDSIGLRPLAKKLKEIERPKVTHILENKTP